MQRLKIRSFTFIFVPGQVGVRGNEKADRFAALATKSENQPMEYVDIIYNLKNIGRWNYFR